MKKPVLSYGNNKGADHAAYPRLGSITPLVAIPEISRLQLALVAERTGLNPTLSLTSEDRFSHDVAQVKPAQVSSICVYFRVQLQVLHLSHRYW